MKSGLEIKSVSEVKTGLGAKAVSEVEEIVEENGKEPYALLKEKPDSNRNRSGNWLLLKLLFLLLLRL